MPLLLQTETGVRAVTENDSDYIDWRTGNVNIYVRKDGNDSNSGFSDSAAGAVLTWNGAVDVMRKLNTRGNVSVRFGAGEWTAFTINMYPFQGNGSLVIYGATGGQRYLTVLRFWDQSL